VATRAMHVPADRMGGVSPERKAARVLQRLFTVVSVAICQGQLLGLGNDGDLSIIPPDGDYQVLTDMLEEIPMSDGTGEAWLAHLLSTHPALGLRILEIRKAYAAEFDYSLLKEYAMKESEATNARLMRDAVRLTSGDLDADGDAAPPGSS